MKISKSEINFLGLRLHNLDMNETIERIAEIIKNGHPKQHVVLNAAKVVQAQKNPNLKKIINDCDIIGADGQAIVWAARSLGFPFKIRVAGIDLMYRLLDESLKRGWRIFFLGSTAQVLNSVLVRVKNEYDPKIIAGSANGYFVESEEKEIVQNIRNSKADIVFVAMGSPQKEIFLNKYLTEMNTPFVMGVGGSFDVFSGKTRRAPRMMQKYGLEWLYRIYQEPGRMWKRYAKTNPVFIYLVAKEFVKRKILKQT